MTRGQIILIGGEKGGVGKSTITTNIAVEMSYRKAEVMIIDTDPQKTSINWIDRRNELIVAACFRNESGSLSSVKTGSN